MCTKYFEHMTRIIWIVDLIMPAILKFIIIWNEIKHNANHNVSLYCWTMFSVQKMEHCLIYSFRNLKTHSLLSKKTSNILCRSYFEYSCALNVFKLIHWLFMFSVCDFFLRFSWSLLIDSLSQFMSGVSISHWRWSIATIPSKHATIVKRSAITGEIDSIDVF